MTELLDGQSYLESLRDGRRVYVDGELVEDVTTHPAFRNSARSIARLYDPQGGRVLIDGEDDRDFTLKSLRDSITFLPQDPMLFRATVADPHRTGHCLADAEKAMSMD